ncbi:uncharacterized protein LOC121729439 [Aricia agestis]|uniref:uncharacterized protein LOC121729439 n=1 Tax=Aricia agestis TaxID=91739 RepID=UPI001C2089BA|nr:uncharacterized protein LOC121729439 [Aricia agestis]
MSFYKHAHKSEMIERKLRFQCKPNIVLRMYYLYLLMVPTVLTYSFLNDLRDVKNSRTEDDIADILKTIGYISEDPDAMKRISDKAPEVIRDDEAHILSKLSDNELLVLLNVQNNKNVNLAESDVIPIPINKHNRPGKDHFEDVLVNNAKKTDALFRLESEVLKPQLQNSEAYKAWQKINNLLSDFTMQPNNNEEQSLNDAEREILFDILVQQLKSLCFNKKMNLPIKKQYISPGQQNNEEYMFLILSEDINEKDNELVSWNSNILEKNASVVVLGPIAGPITKHQLNNIMKRVTTEFSKPEYLSLLQHLSEGMIKNKTVKDILVLDAQSRRYMKPHRCNHRSQLARVYGGPKWLLCTGYLNLNTPSLYD